MSQSWQQQTKLARLCKDNLPKQRQTDQTELRAHSAISVFVNKCNDEDNFKVDTDWKDTHLSRIYVYNKKHDIKDMQYSTSKASNVIIMFFVHHYS